MAAGAVRELITKVKFLIDNSSISKVNAEIRKLKKTLSGIDAKDKNIRIKTTGLETAMAGLARAKAQLRELNGQVANVRVNATIAPLNKKTVMGTVGNQAGFSSGEKGSKFGAIADNGGTLAAAGATAIGSIAFPIKEAMDFESAMADVRKVVDFDTPEQFKEMGRDIAELSTKIPMTQEQIAAIVAAGGQSGIERENLLAFAEAASKMGVAFDISAEQAGQSMAKWRTALGLTQEQVVELADKINYLSNNTSASAPAISDVVTRVGALAQTAGLASGDTAALAASMVGAGAPSEVAATAIQNLVLNLQSGESATKSQMQAFQALGLDAVEMAKRLKVDASGAILEVFKRIKQLDGYRQSSIMEDLLGRESIDAIAPMLGQLDNLEKNLGLVADKSKYAGSMQAEFDARNQTTANSLQLLKNEIKSTAGEIGENLLPYVLLITKELSKASKAIRDFAREHPNLVIGIVGVVGAIGGLLVVLGGLGLALAGIVSAANVLGPAFVAIKGALAGAFGPVIVILGLIAIAIYTILENWDTVVALFRPGLEAMEEGLESLKQAWENIQPFIEALTPLIKIVAQLIGGAIVAAVWVMWNLFTAAFKAIAGLIEWVTGLLGGLGDIIQTIGNALGGIIAQAREFLGMAPAINGMNANVAQRIWDKGTGQNSINQSQNNTYNLPAMDALPAAQNASNSWFGQTDWAYQ